MEAATGIVVAVFTRAIVRVVVITIVIARVIAIVVAAFFLLMLALLIAVIVAVFFVVVVDRIGAAGVNGMDRNDSQAERGQKEGERLPSNPHERSPFSIGGPGPWGRQNVREGMAQYWLS
jgi:hypothetical protein